MVISSNEESFELSLTLFVKMTVNLYLLENFEFSVVGCAVEDINHHLRHHHMHLISILLNHVVLFLLDPFHVIVLDYLSFFEVVLESHPLILHYLHTLLFKIKVFRQMFKLNLDHVQLTLFVA